jgi:hypothetical protein
MNFKRHNMDLILLQEWAKRPRHGRSPGWTGVDWQQTSVGGNMVRISGLSLVGVCSKERTDLKIEAPPDLYQPVGKRLVFYRNVFIDPGLQVFHPTQKRFVPIPRLHPAGQDGLAFLCIHPDPVSPDKNVLWLLEVFDLFLLNPMYKALSSETF